VTRLPIAGLVLLTTLAVGAGAARSTVAAPPSATFSGCPRDTRPFPVAADRFERPLRAAVLQFVRTSLPKISKTPAKDLLGARIRKVVPVRDWLPSGWIKRECGLTVWRDSVAVDVYFPHLDRPRNPVGHCNACAHLTVLTALTRGGWTVWGAV